MEKTVILQKCLKCNSTKVKKVPILTFYLWNGEGKKVEMLSDYICYAYLCNKCHEDYLIFERGINLDYR